jgi:predicted Zn-dependent protease
MMKACAWRRAVVVDAGRVAGYFLSTYSARKLGMKTTGNAGRLAQPAADFAAHAAWR